MKINKLLLCAIVLSSAVFTPYKVFAETVENAIKNQDGDRTYVMTQNETITQHLGYMSGSSLSIEGNNKIIDGKGYHGIYVQEGQKLVLTDVIAKNFKKVYDYSLPSTNGGFVYNKGTIENISGVFENNYADGDGGVIRNDGIIENISGIFENNYAEGESGVIHNEEGKIVSINGTFKNNFSEYFGGVIVNTEGIIENISGVFENNYSQVGGAIYNDGTIKSLSGSFINNSSDFFGGAITNAWGNINIVSKDANTIFTGNKDFFGNGAIINALGTINLNANKNSSIIFNDVIGISTKDIDLLPEETLEMLEMTNESMKEMCNPEMSIININSSTDENVVEAGLSGYTKGTIEFNNEVKRNTVNMYDGTLKFGTNTQEGVEYVGGLVESNLNYYGGLITLQNNGINTANLGNLTLHNEMNLSLDADLAKETIDTISADSFVSNDNKINITNINLLSATDKKELSLSPLSVDMDSTTRQTIADSIIYSGGDVAYGKIYQYAVDYDQTNAMLNFGLQGGKDTPTTLNDFAPSVASKPIAQTGVQAVQTDSFTEAFRNMDMFMLMPENERLVYKYQNKYADSNANFVYDPTMTAYQNNTAWFRPYTTFENIPLKNGPKVSNVKYGTYFGYDSALHELGKGWDGTFGIYAGYNGSHQSFNGNSIYQNGGTLGLIGVAYKGNFFTGWTANIGATAGSTNSIQGEDNFTALMGGISTKNGYNFEFAEGKFIIQPSVMLSYSLVNMFDYTAASGARMKSEPYHTIQLEPGIKFIGNIGTWQPYANVSMVWNMLNEQKITADNVQLPKVNIKPYVKYGVGLQKKWADKFTAFGQVYVTNGGRNGVGLQAGLRVALGDETSKQKTSLRNPKKKDTKIAINGRTK